MNSDDNEFSPVTCALTRAKVAKVEKDVDDLWKENHALRKDFWKEINELKRERLMAIVRVATLLLAVVGFFLGKYLTLGH